MQVKEESKSAAAATSTTNNNNEVVEKRRKLSTKNLAAHRNASSPASSAFSSIPLQRQHSLDSTMMIGEFEAAGEELISGPDLMMMTDNADFFGMNKSADDSMMVDSAWNDDLDILFIENDAANVSMDSPALRAPVQVKTEKTDIPHASPVEAYYSAPATPTVAAIGAVSAAASDISSVLDSLSPELRLRFVDRLAEVMGAQLTQNISQQVQVNVQVAQQQAQTQTQTYTPTPHMYVAPSNSSAYAAPAPVNLIDADHTHFLLPSGSRAPEIALPLASAAIAALLSSMHTFAQNTHMHLQQQNMSASNQVSIKEEVACK